MNLTYQKEEETKTIKYINKSDQDQISDSESSTAKQYQQELLFAQKMFHNSKSSKYPQGHPPNCKIVVIETLQNYGPQHSINSKKYAQPIKNRHKKGKSMDLEQMLTDARQNKKQIYLNQGSKQKTKKSKEFIEQRQRQTISQMKQYTNVHKKIIKQAHEGNIFSKKKKSKTLNQYQGRQARRQIKKIIQDTPIFTKTKKKDSLKQIQRSKNLAPYVTSKHLKNYSKSEELFPKSKQTKKKKNRLQLRSQSQQLKQISFSMPMTSKIIHLFSNNSSIYNSYKQLEIYDGRNILQIPTENSCFQIDQIRQYQNTILKKKSSDGIRNIRKAAPINNILDQQQGKKVESTQNIIQQYITKFSEYQIQQEYFSNQIIRKLKKDDNRFEKCQITQENICDPQINEMKDIKLSQSINLEQSQLINNLNIKKQEQQLDGLNNLIKQLETKGNDIPKKQKEVLFDKIKLIIQKSTNNSPEKKQFLENIQNGVKSIQQLTNSDLKQSFNFDDNMSQLNLQIIDKALRQRQFYLTERKEKQIQRLEQLYDSNDVDFGSQKEKIVKWIDHEIKSVVHTRHQLWKGFNIAKNILQRSDNDSNNHRKGEMMRCLSQKYITKIKKNHHKKENVVIQVETTRMHGQISQKSEKESEHLLKQGRITNSQKQKNDSNISVINKKEFQEEEQQLLISEQKPNKNIVSSKYQFNQQQNKDSQSIDDQYQYDSDNILNKPIQFRSNDNQVQNIHVNISSSVGLNIKQVQCDIQQQNSYDLEELEQLTKEGQKNKDESMKFSVNITADDKEDIYEFIFLDLCVELTDQYSIDSKVIKKIFSFIKTMNEQSKKQKGFKTNTNAIKEYLFQFMSFLKNDSNLIGEVYSNLDKPLGPTAIDILKYMHPYDQQPPQDDSNETVFILDIKLFQQFQNQFLHKKIVFEKYYQDEEKQKKRRAFLKNAIHIHNKAIFDALNETLDKQRPYGVWGQPFSWKKIPKFYHSRDHTIKHNVLLRSSQKTIQYGAFMCGFMIDKEDCNLRGNSNISEVYLEQIRDDRLSRMLANDLEEGEQKMLFIDDEQTQILVQVGHLIYQDLIQEMYCETNLI